MSTGTFDERAIQKLAELAELALTPDECRAFAGQLEQIVRYAERIQSLDTEGVTPTSHALLEAGLEGKSTLREDEPQPSLSRDQVLRGAPDAGEGFFKVPKVLP